MAILGHYVGGFPIAFFFPQESVSFILKLTMLSDSLLILTMPLGLDVSAMWDKRYQKEPPQETLDQVAKWKANGEWLEGVDVAPGDPGFSGFGGLMPYYMDITYSHSVCGMFVIALLVVAFLWLRRPSGISFNFACAVICACISHPLVDMVFHDAYILVGNRARTRGHLDLWMKEELVPFAFLLDLALAYVPYRIWLAARRPVDDSEETAKAIAKYHRMFWMIGIGYNMLSWYTSPLTIYFNVHVMGYDFQSLTMKLVAGVMCNSWAIVLYPMHKLEALLKPIDATKDAFGDDRPYRLL